MVGLTPGKGTISELRIVILSINSTTGARCQLEDRLATANSWEPPSARPCDAGAPPFNGAAHTCTSHPTRLNLEGGPLSCLWIEKDSSPAPSPLKFLPHPFFFHLARFRYSTHRLAASERTSLSFADCVPAGHQPFQRPWSSTPTSDKPVPLSFRHSSSGLDKRKPSHFFPSLFASRHDRRLLN